MEIRVTKMAIPESIDFNYEEIKTELASKLQEYESLVYTDEQIKLAKSDKATLNALKKALNDERIRLEREYLKPFSAFKAQVDELIKMIDKPVALIDEKVKDFEARRKQEKRQKIEEYYKGIEHPEFVTLEMIFDPKWLNASATEKVVQTELNIRLVNIKHDIETIESLPDFAFEAMAAYKTNLDINEAIREGQRLANIQKQKEEAQKALEAQKAAEAEKPAEPVKEEPKPETPIVPVAEQLPREWMRLEICINEQDFDSFEEWASSRNIEWRMQ